MSKQDEWRWRIYKSKMSMKEFCEKYEISQAQLSDWIRGRRKPRSSSIDKIEAFLEDLGV